MELQVPFGGVISRHRLDADSVERFGHSARHHRVAVEIERFGRGLIADDRRRGRHQLLDGRTVEMVVMRMGDKHRIGFRQMRVIGILADRIDIDAPPVEIDGQRSVFEKCEDDRPPVAGRHRIGRIDRRLLLLEQRDHNLAILGDSGRRYEKSRAEANLFALCRNEISEVRPKASEFRETDPPHPRFSPAGPLRRKARSRNSAPCAPALRSEWGRRLLPVTYDQHLRRTPKPFGIGDD